MLCASPSPCGWITCYQKKYKSIKKKDRLTRYNPNFFQRISYVPNRWKKVVSNLRWHEQASTHWFRKCKRLGGTWHRRTCRMKNDPGYDWEEYYAVAEEGRRQGDHARIPSCFWCLQRKGVQLFIKQPTKWTVWLFYAVGLRRCKTARAIRSRSNKNKKRPAFVLNKTFARVGFFLEKKIARVDRIVGLA